MNDQVIGYQIKQISDKIKEIADHYKLEHQLGKTLEELGELSREIRDYKFDLHMKLDDITACRVVDEIADVKVMLAQIEYLIGIEEEVREHIGFKIERQIKRIENEMNCIGYME